MSDIEANDKVVCIANIPKTGASRLFSSLPKKDGIYCVTNVEESIKGNVIIDIVGITCREDESGYTYGFLAEWFRKISPASWRGKEANSAKK